MGPETCCLGGLPTPDCQATTARDSVGHVVLVAVIRTSQWLLHESNEGF